MKAINKIAWFFIIQGIIEVFLGILFTQKIFMMLPGVITVFSAFLMQNLKNKAWAYFVSIWAFIKYNPISTAMFFFLVTDYLHHKGESSIKFLSIYFFTSMALSITMGIITIVKTVKYFKKK